MLGKGLMKVGNKIEKVGRVIAITEAIVSVVVTEKIKDTSRAVRDFFSSKVKATKVRAAKVKTNVKNKARDFKNKVKAYREFKTVKEELLRRANEELEQIAQATTIEELKALEVKATTVNEDRLNTVIAEVLKLKEQIKKLSNAHARDKKELEQQIALSLKVVERGISSVALNSTKATDEDVKELIDSINEIIEDTEETQLLLTYTDKELLEYKPTPTEPIIVYPGVNFKGERNVRTFLNENVRTTGTIFVAPKFVDYDLFKEYEEIVNFDFVADKLESKEVIETIDTNILEELEETKTILAEQEELNHEIEKANSLLESEVNELTDEVNNLNETIDIQEAELEELRIANEQYAEADIEAVDNANDERVLELEKEMEDSKTKYNQVISALQLKVSKLEKTKISNSAKFLKTQVKELSDKLDESLLTNETLKANISSMRSNFSNKVNHLTKQLEKKDSILKDFSSELVKTVKDSKVVDKAKTLFSSLSN